MNKYYQNELESLRDLAAEFSQAYPTLAPQLNAASSDPDVERLLEGVAFLTAKIRQKIDDEFPEFSQGLLKHIFPHYLRPLPSATIVEFSAKSILKNRLQVPVGTYVDSEKIDSISCRFRTTYEIDVWPLSITAVKLSETSTGKKSIDLNFVLNSLNLAKFDSDSIPMHLAGNYHTAADLYYLLLNNVDYVEVTSGTGEKVIIAQDVKISPMGFSNEDALLDYPKNAFPAYRLIQEYFLMKEKFLFVDLLNIGDYIRKLSGNTFVVKFYLKDAHIAIPRIAASNFVLHATPVVNLFEHDAESIVNDHKRSEYRIKPMRDTLNQYHIYSVDSVIGADRKTALKKTYRELGLSDPMMNTEAVYQVIYRQSGTQAGTDAYLSFSYPADYDVAQQDTVLTRLTCSNGDHPVKLRIGDLSKPTSSTSELVSFKNILQPSESQSTPPDSSMLWRLLSHLSLNYLSLADADNFKALLSLYIFSGSVGNKHEVANRKRIDGVKNITVQACDRLVGGTSMRGQSIVVEVDSSNYACKGDMYLFGMLLDYLFGSFSSLNCFTEFSMKDVASEELYVWQTRIGDRPLI